MRTNSDRKKTRVEALVAQEAPFSISSNTPINLELTPSEKAILNLNSE